MLDAYIIDKIRRERESREDDRVPLRIEIPSPSPYDRDPERPEPRPEDEQDRGVVIIDFTV